MRATHFPFERQGVPWSMRGVPSRAARCEHRSVRPMWSATIPTSAPRWTTPRRGPSSTQTSARTLASLLPDPPPLAPALPSRCAVQHVPVAQPRLVRVTCPRPVPDPSTQVRGALSRLRRPRCPRRPRALAALRRAALRRAARRLPRERALALARRSQPLRPQGRRRARPAVEEALPPLFTNPLEPSNLCARRMAVDEALLAAPAHSPASAERHAPFPPPL